MVRKENEQTIQLDLQKQLILPGFDLVLHQLLILELGMTALSQLTVAELKKFAQDLDLIVSTKLKPTKQEYMKSLRIAHAEGRNMLNADGAYLLKARRSKMLNDLQETQIKKLQLNQLRFYAKRLGIKNSVRKNKSYLQQILQKIVSNHTIITEVEPDVDMLDMSEDQQALPAHSLRDDVDSEAERTMNVASNFELEESEKMDIEQRDEQLIKLEPSMFILDEHETLTDMTHASKLEIDATKILVADAWEMQQLNERNEMQRKKKVEFNQEFADMENLDWINLDEWHE